MAIVVPTTNEVQPSRQFCKTFDLALGMAPPKN